MHTPLAYRMRPRTLDELVGQEDTLGPKSALYTLIQKGEVPSMLLYGPPGVGKTSTARAIAGSSDIHFIPLNATTAGKSDIQEIVAETRLRGRVILFLDEIHRFNKLQQDTLLPHVENGSIILIGATTENPFHDVNPAIRSRCGAIVQLERLSSDHLTVILQRALTDSKRGLGHQTIEIEDQDIQIIAESVGGDARKALTVLQSAVQASDERDAKIIVQSETVASLLKRVGTFGDKGGSHFYNLLSALQKSVRGSDTDAALFYLAALLENGDLTAVTRRLLVMAYEDVGLASPEIGPHVLAATEAALRLGMPEARIPLAQAVIEMTVAEKSNSAYKAIDRASRRLRHVKVAEVPPHLKDTHYAGAAELGHEGYIYPHDTPVGTFGGWTKQQYLPDTIEDATFYQPVEAGEEIRMGKIYKRLKRANR